MDLPRWDDDTLAQATRAGLFETLEKLRRPADTAELAEISGLHINGVRRHLGRMLEAGLLRQTVVRNGRGRPRHEWTISDSALPGGQHPTAYSDLSGWLARAIASGSVELDEIESTGRAIGAELPPSSEAEGSERFRSLMASLGFNPEIETSGENTVCSLNNCPYRGSVEVNPEVICTLHRGITVGILESLAPGARLERFEPRDPETAGCLVEISGTSWK